jgi:hypothetical protein
LNSSAQFPNALFQLPEVFAFNALFPSAVLSMPVVVEIED